MTDSRRPITPPTDDAIREMLESRASHVHPSSIDLATIVAAASPPASVRLRRAPRLSLVASTVAAVLVASALIAIPLFNRPVGSSAPASGASGLSSSSNGPTPGPTPFALPRVLSPSELADLLRTRADELNGRLVAVNGRLAHPLRCLDCAALVFEGTNPAYTLRLPPPPTTWVPDPADLRVDRTYLARMTNAQENGEPVVDLLGEFDTGRTHGLTVTVAELLQGDVGAGGQYVAVDGWLVRTPLHPCPSRPPLPSGVTTSSLTIGCPDDDYLTDLEFQPLQPDGSSIGSAEAIDLPAGTYDHWAPNPARFGKDGVGVVPRRAVFLMRLSMDSRASNGIDRVDGPLPTWHLVGRLDSIWDSPAASPSSPPATTSPSSIASSVADVLVQQSTDVHPQEFTIHAYLVATPPLRCRLAEPVPSGLPAYGCDEVDWLTDDPFQPWVADGITGTTRQPPVGIRVQNGAYQAFAPDPSSGQLGAREPRLGTYVVRFGVRSSCDYAIRSPETTCLGGPILNWELVDRLP